MNLYHRYQFFHCFACGRTAPSCLHPKACRQSFFTRHPWRRNSYEYMARLGRNRGTALCSHRKKSQLNHSCLYRHIYDLDSAECDCGYNADLLSSKFIIHTSVRARGETFGYSFQATRHCNVHRAIDAARLKEYEYCCKRNSPWYTHASMHGVECAR